MLTEKEIERLIWEKLRPKLTDTGLSIVQAVSGGPIKEAAAAIAKRLSEGVVYSGEHSAYVRRDGTVSIALAPIQIGHRPDIKQGEILEVTVKIVEGSSGGNDVSERQAEENGQ